MREAKTILVVDDVPMFRELASVFLARTARVRTASSPEQALEIARRERVDLIVADLHMRLIARMKINGDTVPRTR